MCQVLGLYESVAAEAKSDVWRICGESIVGKICESDKKANEE